MKKPLKRFLVMTQVLVLGALAATACTKNTDENKPAKTAVQNDTPTKDQTKNSDDPKKDSMDSTVKDARANLVSQSKVIKDTDSAENNKVRMELIKGVFKDILNKEDLIPGDSGNNANGQLKSLPDQFPVIIEDESGNANMKKHNEFLDKYESTIYKNELSSDKEVSPPSAIDDSKKSIDGVNGPLDPQQKAPPVKK